MSTAEYPDALTRRLELLAAAPGGEPEGETSAVAALVRGLRAEIGAVRAELGALRAETGAVRGDLDGLGGRVDDGAADVRRTIAEAQDREDRAAEGTRARLEDARAALESRLAALEDALDGTSERIEALARDGASTTSARLVSLEGGVAALTQRVEAGLSGLEDALLGRLSVVLQQRDEALRSEVLAAVGAQAEAVRARLAALEETVGQSRTDVTGRVGELHDVVSRGAGATQEALTGLRALTGSTDALAQTVDGFRTEWPTRTDEVVEGARAVADGVVRQVRAEVGAQLERVRDELERAVGCVDAARDGLDAGIDRLAQAGAVLVAYLEQRDRLLEAERDTVLHDVLDTFAAGLSARDRAALAGRVGDAVARRRDGRDAERYRAAVGRPVSPTADLPADVRRLAEVPPAPEPTVEPPLPAPEVSVEAAVVPEPPAHPAVRATPRGATSQVATSRVALPRVAATRGPSGTSVTVRPTVGPSTPAGASPEAAPAAPAEPRRESPRGGAGADRRARVDVMPQVRSPEVALEAAAPSPPAPPQAPAAAEDHEDDRRVVRRPRS